MSEFIQVDGMLGNELTGYRSISRPCDDPHETFERNRGKWTAEPVKRVDVVSKRRTMEGRINEARSIGKRGSNPNNWRKCAATGCQTMCWKNTVYCPAHRP